jgi:hypothetical protein
MMMKSALLLTLLLFWLGSSAGVSNRPKPDVFWLDRYRHISWENEKARLDNFAIQLMKHPETMGYLYVQAGRVSCKGEAQAHAVRAKNYMIKIRNADWNRIVWRDIGYGDEFEVSIWLAPRGRPPLPVPEYQRATEKHVINECGINPLRQRKPAKSRRI